MLLTEHHSYDVKYWAHKKKKKAVDVNESYIS
jgi:hypothetical protein